MYLDRYRDTVALYEQEFGARPHKSIWPKPPRSAAPKSLGGLGAMARLAVFFGGIYLPLTYVLIGVPVPFALMASAVGSVMLLMMTAPGGEGAITFSFDRDSSGDGGGGGDCGAVAAIDRFRRLTPALRRA